MLASRHRSPRRSICVALATCLSLAFVDVVPREAMAAPAEANNAEAEAIFRRGQAKYETADYSGAIELWTEAYALIDSTPENASIKALLIFNLAQAHVKAHELDGDPIHLKQAQQLLHSFKDNLELLYEDQAQLDEEAKKVDEKLAEVEQMIAALQQPEPEPEPEPEPPPPNVEPPPVDEPPVPKSGTPLIISGAALHGAVTAFGIVAIVGGIMGRRANDISDLEPTQLAEREDRFASGRTGNIMLIVGAVGVGVVLPIAETLLHVGIKRNKARKRQLGQLQPRIGAGGLTITGRF